jgi:hypothetical protein
MKLVAAALLLLLPALCFGANNTVLIINGSSGTSEPGTTSSVTTNLSADIVAAGGVVTVADTIPASINGYAQVWDVRFSNNLPLSAADIAQYAACLANGGTMFVMGENAGFATRNNSVLALIAASGGGSLTYVIPGQTQNVLSPFTLPNPVSTITYNASGGVPGTSHPGTGAFMTVDAGGTGGSGIWWARGTLTNASSGTLAVVFDVNFMMTSADTNSQNFVKNLVGQFHQISSGAVAAAPTGVPTLSEFGLILLGLLLVIMAARALRIPARQ